MKEFGQDLLDMLSLFVANWQHVFGNLFSGNVTAPAYYWNSFMSLWLHVKNTTPYPVNFTEVLQVKKMIQ